MENAKDKKEEQTKNADTSAAREMGCSCAGYMERIKAIDSMEDMEQNVWEALHMFRKLNIGSILPHLNKGEFVLMNGIYHVQKKIGSGHGVKMSDLAEYTHALPPAVSRSIKALEEKGYVRRFVDQKDRRNTLVEITKSGQEVLEESNEITNEFIRRVFEKTDKEEMARLVSYIHQQYDLAKEELEKIIAGKIGKSVEVKFVLQADEHLNTGKLSRINVEDALKQIHAEIEVEDE